MSVRLPNGSLIAIAASYGASKAMSALTNAATAVATLAASHGVIVNDVLEVTSGWSKLNNRILRASAVATNDVSLEGLNSLDTTKYPAGGGVGSVREVLTWQQILQILEISTSGGEQGFTTYSFLEDDTERQIPTQKSPVQITIQIGDDDTLAHYPILVAADEDRLQRAVRLTLPGGAVIFYNAFVTFNKTPSLTKNEVMALTATLSLTAEQTRYAA